MQTTQLSCPHCGSMINLGGVIAPGTPVTCLICMQPFAAAPVAVASASPAQARPVAPKPQAGILVRKPHAAAKPERTPPPRKLAPAAEPPAPPREGKGMWWAAALTSLLLFTAGAAVAYWKFNDAGGSGSEQLIAVNQKSGPEPKVADNKVPAAPGKGKEVAADTVPNAKDTPGDDDDPREKKGIQKIALKRKQTADPGGKEPEIDPIPTIHVPAPVVPGVEPARVSAAVDKGIAFLKRTQAPNGTWNAAGFPIGATALGGLTLLECKVPAIDPHVQRVASFVRGSGGNLSTTYEISLAILFLDRLGDPSDRPLIQALALRLLAGQKDCGGWTYDCPVLDAKDMFQLDTYLRSNQPAAKKNKGPIVKDAGKNPISGGPVVQEFARLIAERDAVKDLNDDEAKPMRPDKLALALRTLPVVRNQGAKKGSLELRAVSGATDNSNTQFALLALWAARRYQIVSDVALLTAHQRFERTQFADATWDYLPIGTPRASLNNTMTCVGLLGLAMGHGVAPDVVQDIPNDPKGAVTKPALQDPRIGKGLKALAQYLGNVASEKDNVGPIENMYFMWSVERVAMLYDLQAIDGKDWYGWGAQILLKHQHPGGDWPSKGYPGDTPHVNTCFALLFLKRSNLVQDLTLHLRLATTVRDPEK